MKKRRISVGSFQIGEREREAIIGVLNEGRISEGRRVQMFEEMFARFIGTRYAVATSSGTGALLAGIMAIDLLQNLKKQGKTKVITTPLTYIATTNAIVLNGFEPVFVDIDKTNFSIIPEEIEDRIRSDGAEKYAFILPVHLMGYPCDMERINQIAKSFSLSVIEDSAQAHGTIYNGKKTGSTSLFSIFSFYIAHNIQAGEMGAVITDSSDIARLIRKIKANGRLCDCPLCRRSEGKCPRLSGNEEDVDPRFVHDIIGYNLKTMEFQAALAITQLERVDEILKKRQENVGYLNKHLKAYEEILALPRYSDEISYLAYPIVIKRPEVVKREKLMRRLEELGVETRPLFGCIPTQQPAFKYLKEVYEGRLPNAEYIGRNSFYIGCHQYITREDLDYIVWAFGEVLNGQ